MRSKRKRANQKGLTRFKAGVLMIVLIAVATFFAFTKTNPFANPYQMVGVFQNVNGLKPNSPVRIAGIEVGKVKKVEAIDGSSGAARVTMDVMKSGLPIHKDAELKVRPRTFLEGNYFVDVKPGSPSAPLLKTGQAIPTTQTAAPVQFGDVLAALQSDTRSDLQVFLREYSKGISGKGGRGFNQSLREGPQAFRTTSEVNDALLGLDPTKDLQRVLKGQAKTFAALDRDPEALKGLVTNLNTFAGALASQDTALEASIPALRDTLRVGTPALGSLNSALPTLSAFARDALPGVRSSAPTLKASLPFIRQARLLVGPNELQATARELRRQIPNLAGLNSAAIPVLSQLRTLSSCTSNVLVPFSETPVPNPDEPGNTNQLPLRQANRGFVGLAGESRVSDGNLQYVRTRAVAPPANVRPAAPSDGGLQPPPRRPDVPCETQEVPNLNALGGSILKFST
ncbi:MAG: MlaD family protein, partial [Thermoleophilaceae bacterium]